MSFPVRLEVFEGPLGLLLHLISRQRLDVAEVSISTITDEYLKAIGELPEMDLEAATAFLVLAATLLELKSLKLLPVACPADPELAALLEERDLLLHRLIEYSAFKRAAGALAELLDENDGYHPRTAGVPDELAGTLPDLLEGVDPERLAELARKALTARPPPEVDASSVAPARIALTEVIDRLAVEIRRRGTTSFHRLCRQGNRVEVVVAFLALLELFRREEVELEQGARFDDIVVLWRHPAG